MASYVFAAGSYCRSGPLYVVWIRYPMSVANHKGSVAVRYPLHKVPFVESVQGADGNTKVIVSDDFKVMFVDGCKVGWLDHGMSFPSV